MKLQDVVNDVQVLTSKLRYGWNNKLIFENAADQENQATLKMNCVLGAGWKTVVGQLCDRLSHSDIIFDGDSAASSNVRLLLKEAETFLSLFLQTEGRSVNIDTNELRKGITKAIEENQSTFEAVDDIMELLMKLKLL